MLGPFSVLADSGEPCEKGGTTSPLQIPQSDQHEPDDLNKGDDICFQFASLIITNAINFLI